MAKGVYVGVGTVTSGTESRQTLQYGIGTRPGYVGIHIPTWDEISQKYVFSESDNPIRMGPNNTWYNIWTEDHEYKCAIIDGNPNIFYGLTTNGFEDESGFYEERVPKARKVNKIYIGVSETVYELDAGESKTMPTGMVLNTYLGTSYTIESSGAITVNQNVLVATGNDLVGKYFAHPGGTEKTSAGIVTAKSLYQIDSVNEAAGIIICTCRQTQQTLKQTARKITKGYIGAPGDVVNATLTADEMAAKVILDDGSVNPGTVSETRPEYSKPGDFTWFYAIAGNTVSNQDAWGSWIEGGIGDDFVFAKLDDEMHYYYERVSVSGEYQFKQYTRGSVARQFWPAITLDPTFANNSWANIIYACQNKIVPDTWAVGNQKPITVGNYEYKIDIIGKNYDNYSDGSGKAPLTFQMHNCFFNTLQMNDGLTNHGGWAQSLMRTNFANQFFNSLPLEFKNAIREVNKTTSAGNTSSSIVTTADKMFLLSEIEIFGITPNSYAGEGVQYSYYATGGNKAKTIGNSTGYIGWWTRSPYAWGSTDFDTVTSSGGTSFTGSSSSIGVPWAFCF